MTVVVVSSLKIALDLVSRLIPPRPPRESLGYIFFEIGDSTLSVITSDDGGWMRVEIPATGTKRGKILVNKAVNGIVSKLPVGEISLDIQEKSLSLETNTSSYQIAGYYEESSEPKLPFFDAAVEGSEGFLRDIQEVFPVVPSANGTKQALEGVRLSGNEIVAVDGHRLILRQEDDDFTVGTGRTVRQEHIELITPIVNALPVERYEIAFSPEGKYTAFQFFLKGKGEKETVIVDLVCGVVNLDYPDHKKLLESHLGSSDGQKEKSRLKVTCSRDQLIEVVDRCSAITDTVINIKTVDGELHLFAEDPIGNSALDRIPYSGDNLPTTVSIKPSYLKDAAKRSSLRQVTLTFDSKQPANKPLIFPKEGGSGLELVMPIQLASRS